MTDKIGLIVEKRIAAVAARYPGKQAILEDSARWELDHAKSWDRDATRAFNNIIKAWKRTSQLLNSSECAIFQIDGGTSTGHIDTMAWRLVRKNVELGTISFNLKSDGYVLITRKEFSRSVSTRTAYKSYLREFSNFIEYYLGPPEAS